MFSPPPKVLSCLNAWKTSENKYIKRTLCSSLVGTRGDGFFCFLAFCWAVSRHCEQYTIWNGSNNTELTSEKSLLSALPDADTHPSPSSDKSAGDLWVCSLRALNKNLVGPTGMISEAPGNTARRQTGLTVPHYQPGLPCPQGAAGGRGQAMAPRQDI